MDAVEMKLRQLMLASLEGDAQAYRALLHDVTRHLRTYYRSRLSRIGRSHSDLEDLVQDALMAIHTHRHTYDPRQPFTPWLHAISRYKFIDHLRRTNAALRDISLDDGLEVAGEEELTPGESALDLNRLLGSLPTKMQTAIKLVKIEGLSVSDAAACSGMSESAIKVSVHRGMKAMAMMISRRSAK